MYRVSRDAEYDNERDDESREDQSECQGKSEGNFFMFCLGVGDVWVCEGEGAVDGGLVGPGVTDCCDYSAFILALLYLCIWIDGTYTITVQSRMYDSTRRLGVILRMMVILVWLKSWLGDKLK